MRNQFVTFESLDAEGPPKQLKRNAATRVVEDSEREGEPVFEVVEEDGGHYIIFYYR